MATPPPPWKQNLPQHLSQARHNFRLYTQLKDAGEFPDWAVTTLFYTALPLIQACLLDMATNAFDTPKSHEQRDRFVRRKLGDLWIPYSFLQNQSTRARYHPDQPKPTLPQLQQYESNEFAAILTALARRGIQLVP